MLRWLRIAHGGVNPEGGCAVPDVGSCDHGVEEGGVVVHANIFNLQRVNVGTCLLIQEILLHGLIDLFTGHLILEVATNRFVNFVHVGGDVLA